METHLTKSESDHALKPEWIRIPEAVRLTGLSRSKIYELMKSGLIRNSSFAELLRICFLLLRICFFNPAAPSPRIAPGWRGCRGGSAELGEGFWRATREEHELVPEVKGYQGRFYIYLVYLSWSVVGRVDN